MKVPRIVPHVGRCPACGHPISATSLAEFGRALRDHIPDEAFEEFVLKLTTQPMPGWRQPVDVSLAGGCRVRQ